MKNIALIGFMGAGKTTVAALLSKELNLSLVETDIAIIRLSGLTSVNDIFDKKGEEYFRELEKKVIAEVTKNNNQVISCGGGVISSAESMQALKNNAIVIFLHASFDEIKDRLKNSTNRPLFRHEEKAMLVYAERLPIYERYADEIIDTDNKKPEEIVQYIINKYKNNETIRNQKHLANIRQC